MDITPKKRIMWSKMSLAELFKTPCAPAWEQLQKRLDLLNPSNLDHLAQIDTIAKHVADWPRHVSRPPLPHWKRPDARLRACLIIYEKVTYNDYRTGLCMAFRLSNGRTAVKLRRRYVGRAMDMSGHDIQVNHAGEGDTNGRFILELPGGYLAVVLSVEVKMSGGRAEDDQIKEAKEIIDDGGIAVIAVGVQDAIAQITAQRDEILRRIRS